MRAALFALAVGVAGCGAGGGLKYNLAPPANPPDPAPIAKSPDCAFNIVQEGPPGQWDELGTLTPVDFAASSQDELKGAIHTDVCKLGGETVVSKQTTDGQYHKALVLRRHVEPGAQPAGGAPAPAPAPAP